MLFQTQWFYTTNSSVSFIVMYSLESMMNENIPAAKLDCILNTNMYIQCIYNTSMSWLYRVSESYFCFAIRPFAHRTVT